MARMLGISPSTVSRSLNDHPDISADTRRAVRELASQFDYQPNPTALRLKNQKTKTIGVVVPEIVHFFFSTVISGIESVAHEAGYQLIFCQSNESLEKEIRDIKMLLSHRIDGILVSRAKEAISIDHFRDIKVPLVFFDRLTTGIEASNVVVDDYLGAKAATNHLISQHCRRIAHISAPLNLSIGLDRLNGYKDSLVENGLPIDDDLIISDDNGRSEDGYQCMQKLLSHSKRPDAVFANNDMVAYGAMQAIKEAGLNIPHDIAVIGFSDWQPSELLEPALSSVRQPGFEMGATASQILLRQIDNPGMVRGESTVLQTNLVCRRSSLKQQLVAEA